MLCMLLKDVLEGIRGCVRGYIKGGLKDVLERIFEGVRKHGLRRYDVITTCLRQSLLVFIHFRRSVPRLIHPSYLHPLPTSFPFPRPGTLVAIITTLIIVIVMVVGGGGGLVVEIRGDRTGDIDSLTSGKLCLYLQYMVFAVGRLC